MASRETNRLPENVIRKKMNASTDLPLNMVKIVKPSGKYVVYHFDPLELHKEQYQPSYILAEVAGNKERILAKGEAVMGLSVRVGSFKTFSFDAEVVDMGKFAFYCE
jgi:hypothetical protein